MRRFRLRPHHIDLLIARRSVSPKERRAIILATARLYGDRGFAGRERAFVESVTEETLVQVVLGNDYICNQLKCPFKKQCKTGNYEEVANALAVNLDGSDRDLVKQLTPEISDKWCIRRYDLKVGRTYRLGKIRVVNHSLSLKDLD